MLIVLDQLLESNKRVSSEKSQFFGEKVDYLGFMVSLGGCSTNASKVEAIKKFLQPTTLFHVRSFLGLAGYYKRFCLQNR